MIRPDRSDHGSEVAVEQDGILLLDKPADWTSHDVVARTRRLFGTRKVGHAGTLDPMATGLLVLGINRGTRLLTYLVGCDKDYRATIRLGLSTTTDDAQGEPLERADTTALTSAAIETAVRELTGDQQQVPSAVSAIKVDGQRAYARVRAGQQVELAARAVHVASFEVLAQRTVADPDGALLDLDVEVSVSSGTYVRALARDLGRALGVGGYLTSLRRTRVGGFALAQANTLQALAADGGPPWSRLLSLSEAAALALPVRQLSAAETRDVGYGRRIASAQPGRTEPVAALDPQGRLVAVLTEQEATVQLRTVFAPAQASPPHGQERRIDD